MYVSGQIPLNPESGEMVTGGIEKEAVQVLENFKAVVEASGSSMKNGIYNPGNMSVALFNH